MATLSAIVEHLDLLLRTSEVPDYPSALNGLQLSGRDDILRVAAAVDFSSYAVEQAAARDAGLLLVHHGMFWGGLQAIRGRAYDRIATLVRKGIAVYASHLPLDLHPEFGNNALLARELGLEPNGGFAKYQTIDVGVSGDASLPTRELVARAEAFARRHGHNTVVTPFADGRVTRRWGICTGAGASSSTLREAMERGIDTLVVGEGPHHTAVDARDNDMVVVYAGHYATETLGVRALAAHLADRFGVSTDFIEAPTGL